jgi:hypothetical protein
MRNVPAFLPPFVAGWAPIVNLCRLGPLVSPRVLDTRLAETLKFARSRDIRQLIERNLEELERYGRLRRRDRDLSRWFGSYDR